MKRGSATNALLEALQQHKKQGENTMKNKRERIRIPAWIAGYVVADKLNLNELNEQLKDRNKPDADDNKTYPSVKDDEIHRFGHSCRFCHDPRFEPGECGVCKLKTCYSDCTYCDKCRSDICGNCDCGHLD